MTSFRLINTTITGSSRRDKKEKEKAEKPSHFGKERKLVDDCVLSVRGRRRMMMLI